MVVARNIAQQPQVTGGWFRGTPLQKPPSRGLEGSGGEGGVFPVFTLLGNPLHMDLRNAYLYSLPLHFTV